MYLEPDQPPSTFPFLPHRPPPDTGSPEKASPSLPISPASQGTSLLSNTPQSPQPSAALAPPQAPVSAVPGSSTAPGSPRLSTDAGGGPPGAAAPGAAPSDSESALSVQTGDGDKQKKGHRRGRSLTGLIPTLKTKPKRCQSQLFEVICHTPPLSPPPLAPSVPVLRKLSSIAITPPAHQNMCVMGNWILNWRAYYSRHTFVLDSEEGHQALYLISQYPVTNYLVNLYLGCKALHLVTLCLTCDLGLTCATLDVGCVASNST